MQANNMAAMREALADVLVEMKRRENSRYYPKVARNIMRQYRIRIEAIVRRAYHKIDTAVCAIDDATSADIDDVRKAMDSTLGNYYE